MASPTTSIDSKKITLDTKTIPGLIIIKAGAEVGQVFAAFSIIAITPSADRPNSICQVSVEQGWTRPVPVSVGRMTAALKRAREAGERRYVNQQAKAAVAQHVRPAKAD